MKRKYLYITGYSNLNSYNANLTNVLYTSNSLKKISKNIIIVLFSPLKYIFRSQSKLQEIDPNLSLSFIKIPYFKTRFIYLFNDFICIALGLIFNLLGYTVYTRNCRVAIWLYKLNCKKIAIELHDCSKRSISSYIICKSALFFPISNGIIEKLKELKLNRKTKLLPDAATLLDGIKKGYLDNKRKNVVYVGSSNKGKGIKTIIDLARINKNITFHIVGYVRNKTSIKEMENLIFHGFKNKIEITEFLKNADILIAPYEKNVFDNLGNEITNYMSPLKIFEYMASKTPFIVTRMNFIQDFLIEDIHCFMANPNDLEEWSKKINILIDNPKVGNKIANNSYKVYKSKYTWDIRANTINDYINE